MFPVGSAAVVLGFDAGFVSQSGLLTAIGFDTGTIFGLADSLGAVAFCLFRRCLGAGFSFLCFSRCTRFSINARPLGSLRSALCCLDSLGGFALGPLLGLAAHLSLTLHALPFCIFGFLPAPIFVLLAADGFLAFAQFGFASFNLG